MMEFIKTPIGRDFFGKQVPNIIKALDKIGNELERLNDNLEGKEKKEDE